MVKLSTNVDNIVVERVLESLWREEKKAKWIAMYRVIMKLFEIILIREKCVEFL